MIEIIYNKEKESAVGNEEYFCVPRNIRQVGQPSVDCKIYVEDYVYRFLTKEQKETEHKGKMAILLGKSNWKDGIFYIFVKSSLVVEHMDIEEDYFTIKDAIWGWIYEEMKKYFPGQDVIGWYLDRVGGSLNMTDMIKRVHLTHFGGNDKVLYLADSEEQDNAFFIYRNGKMKRQMGYYIFYEKNEPMQEYILEKNPKVSVDYTGKPQDRAVNDFRKIIARKRVEKESKKADRMFHGIAATAAVAAIVLGVMWMRKTPLGMKLFSLKSQTVTEHEQISEQTDNVEMVLEDMQGGLDAGHNTSEMTEETEKSNVLESQTEQEIKTESQKVVNEVINDTVNEVLDEVGNLNAMNLSEYTIRRGDTLTAISIRYYGDMSKVAEICKINNMTQEDIIYEGQKILLP